MFALALTGVKTALTATEIAALIAASATVITALGTASAEIIKAVKE